MSTYKILSDTSCDIPAAVLEQLGAQMLFAGVAQKPGSPMLAAEVAGKLVFCLSGNPFAAAATLEQYAVPALLRAAGRCEESCILPRTIRTLTTGFSKPSKGNRYLRANLPDMKLTPKAWQTELAALTAENEAEYAKLKAQREEVAELQKVRRYVDIALKADTPQKTKSKYHDIDR